MEKAIAKIRSTFLGVEDHGILTFNLELDYGGSVQGAGNLMLDWKDDRVEEYRRVGGDWCAPLLRAVMEACGVNSWEQLPGRTVYALIEDGWVIGIEPLPTERGKKVIFKEVMQLYRDTAVIA